MKIEIKSRRSSEIKFTATINGNKFRTASKRLGAAALEAIRKGADLRGVDLSGVDLRGVDLSGVDLSGVDLSGADLRGADLRGADLSGADLLGVYLSGADLLGVYLRGADLRGVELLGVYLSGVYLSGVELSGIPKIENIHQEVFKHASHNGNLDMNSWHGDCGTTHCRAGWVTTLAGDEGKELEDKFGTGSAAALIYMKSDPDLERIPNWMASNEVALEDMKMLAEKEAAK